MRLAEKYRPQTWEQVVGQKDIVKSIRANIKNRDRLGMPHYLFIGPIPGTGKTTIAALIAKYLNVDFHEFNASDERKIEFVRTEIKRLSQFQGTRVIFLDEADQLTKPAQNAMRRIVEQTTNSIFVLTGNYEDQIIDAMKSRCTIHRFPPLKSEDIEKKIIEIINGEKIKLDAGTPEKKKIVRAGLARLVEQSNGDLRTAIGILQKIVDDGLQITPESVAILGDTTSLHTLALNYALSGNFEAALQTVEKAHIEGRYDSRLTFKELYKALKTVENREWKIRLYAKLGEIEANSKRAGDPIIQLISFMAYVWIVPHLTACPVLESQK